MYNSTPGDEISTIQMWQKLLAQVICLGRANNVPRRITSAGVPAPSVLSIYIGFRWFDVNVIMFETSSKGRVLCKVGQYRLLEEDTLYHTTSKQRATDRNRDYLSSRQFDVNTHMLSLIFSSQIFLYSYFPLKLSPGGGITPT